MTEQKENQKRKARGARSKSEAAPSNTVKSNRLELLITTVGRNKADYFADYIQSFDVNMQMLAVAEGTASAGRLGIMGIGDSSKTVIFSVIQENKIPDALAGLEEKFNTIKGGRGIAFTVPLTSVIGTLIFGFLSNNKMAVKENNK